MKSFSKYCVSLVLVQIHKTNGLLSARPPQNSSVAPSSQETYSPHVAPTPDGFHVIPQPPDGTIRDGHPFYKHERYSSSLFDSVCGGLKMIDFPEKAAYVDGENGNHLRRQYLHWVKANWSFNPQITCDGVHLESDNKSGIFCHRVERGQNCYDFLRWWTTHMLNGREDSDIQVDDSDIKVLAYMWGVGIKVYVQDGDVLMPDPDVYLPFTKERGLEHDICLNSKPVQGMIYLLHTTNQPGKPDHFDLLKPVDPHFVAQDLLEMQSQQTRDTERCEELEQERKQAQKSKKIQQVVLSQKRQDELKDLNSIVDVWRQRSDESSSIFHRFFYKKPFGHWKNNTDARKEMQERSNKSQRFADKKSFDQLKHRTKIKQQQQEKKKTTDEILKNALSKKQSESVNQTFSKLKKYGQAKKAARHSEIMSHGTTGNFSWRGQNFSFEERIAKRDPPDELIAYTEKRSHQKKVVYPQLKEFLNSDEYIEELWLEMAEWIDYIDSAETQWIDSKNNDSGFVVKPEFMDFDAARRPDECVQDFVARRGDYFRKCVQTYLKSIDDRQCHSCVNVLENECPESFTEFTDHLSRRRFELLDFSTFYFDHWLQSKAKKYGQAKETAQEKRRREQFEERKKKWKEMDEERRRKRDLRKKSKMSSTPKSLKKSLDKWKKWKNQVKDREELTNEILELFDWEDPLNPWINQAERQKSESDVHEACDQFEEDFGNFDAILADALKDYRQAKRDAEQKKKNEEGVAKDGPGQHSTFDPNRLHQCYLQRKFSSRTESRFMPLFSPAPPPVSNSDSNVSVSASEPTHSPSVEQSVSLLDEHDQEHSHMAPMKETDLQSEQYNHTASQNSKLGTESAAQQHNQGDAVIRPTNSTEQSDFAKQKVVDDLTQRFWEVLPVSATPPYHPLTDAECELVARAFLDKYPDAYVSSDTDAIHHVSYEIASRFLNRYLESKLQDEAVVGRDCVI